MNIRLADKLLLLRKHYNLSQKTIANKTSIPLNDYMSYENGSAVPSFNELKRIANVKDYKQIRSIAIESNSRLHNNQYEKKVIKLK